MGYPLQFLIYSCWDRNLFFYRKLLIWLSHEKLGLLEGTTKKSVCGPSELNCLFESCLFWGYFWVIVNAYWETGSEKKATADRHVREKSSLASGSPPGVLRFHAAFVMQGKSLGARQKIGLWTGGVLLWRHQLSLLWRMLCDELISGNVMTVCSRRYYWLKSSCDRRGTLSSWTKYEHPVPVQWGRMGLQEAQFLPEGLLRL